MVTCLLLGGKVLAAGPHVSSLRSIGEVPELSYLMYGLGALSLLLLLMFFWVSSLRSVVRRKTAELEAGQLKLRERVKEQRCLAAVIEASADLQRPLAEMLQAAVDELPAGWSYPEITAARIEWGDCSYRCGEDAPVAAELCAAIDDGGGEGRGRICVAYREPRPVADEGPFLKEERALLNGVAARLGGILQRRRALELVRESEERFRILIEKTPQAISLIEDGHFVRANQAALDMLGLQAAEQLLGKTLADISPPTQEDGSASAAKIAERVASALAQRSLKFDWVHLRADGTPIVASVRLTAIRQGGKDVLFTLWDDVTGERARERQLADYQQGLERLVEQRTAELTASGESLRLANEEQQAIFETATSGIALLKERVFIRANRRLHEMFGWPPGGMIGQSTAIWYPDAPSAAAGGEPVYEQIWQGQPHTREQELVRRDGSRFWVRLTGNAVDIGDREKGTVWVLDDISAERAAIEQMARARCLAEEAAQAKSNFLANMSHEIRTPMNAVIGMTHLVLKTELNARQREYLGKIQASSLHLLGILNDILDFSKMEAGKMVVEQIDFDLEKVLDDAVGLVAERAAAKGLELIVKVDADVPRYLRGDPLRVGQVLANYLNNAVKFTERGEIVIHVSLKGTLAATDELELRCVVRDTGIGLDEAQRRSLFQSFQQADNSTTRQFGGTGLGLAISKRLAELMGGEVGVDSRLGEGSAFWFTLRCGRGRDVGRRLLPEGELRGRRVLVVDDNDYAREVIGDMLRAMSFVVDAVASGELGVGAVAQAAAAGTPYAIVFLDWQMPGMDGIETARRIHALGLRDEPYLLMVTAYGRDGLLAAADAAGIVDVLNKPATPSMLFDAVMRVFGMASEARSEPAAPSVGEAAARRRIAGARVLLAEDNELNQEVALEFLHEFGLVVDLAPDGAAALAKATAGDYDLILMDMQMPKMDGLAATREIRKLAHCKQLPIVAMTANALPADRERCIDAGMNDYLAKPIIPEELLARLVKWIAPQAGRGRGLADDLAPLAAELPRNCLAAITGLDSALGLRQVMGREALYFSLLRKFVSGEADLPERLAHALAEADWARLEREAHTLKGVSAQIGASEIRRLAESVERAAHHREARRDIEALLDALGQQLPPLLAAIAACLPAEPATAVAAVREVDREQVCRIGQQLLCHLESGDFASEQLLAAHEPLFRAALGERYAALSDAVRNFDFDAAGVLLRALLAEPDSAG